MQNKRVTIIAAIAQNGVIGDKNALLWHIREDMVHFRTLTSGHPVIMGRKTWESLGRPLPKRTNVVITRQDMQIEGCTVVHSLDEALALFDPSEEVFIIGGAQIYAEALSVADCMQLTIVRHDYGGDTSFPEWSAEEWEEVSRQKFARGEEYEYPFEFVEYRRRS